MTLFDVIIITAILLFIGLLVWSRVMDQTMLATLIELKTIVLEVFGGKK